MGTLYIVATPIGNLEDITFRAIKIIFSVDILLCEDTRRTNLLLQALQIRFAFIYQYMKAKTKLVSYYDKIEDKRVPEIIDALMQGRNVALVSDAGTPLISDPGFRLVRECIKREIKVESIPGPSALLAALTGSGLPPDKFIFLGFVNKKNFRFIQKGVTAIFYSAPHKFQHDLSNIRTEFGDIEIVVARELTKIHEETWRGKISDASIYFSKPQGEFVLLLNIPRG